jgi:hypothetical protein
VSAFPVRITDEIQRELSTVLPSSTHESGVMLLNRRPLRTIVQY